MPRAIADGNSRQHDSAVGCNWPVAGGGYFRLTPLALTHWAIRRINREEPTGGRLSSSLGIRSGSTARRSRTTALALSSLCQSATHCERLQDCSASFALPPSRTYSPATDSWHRSRRARALARSIRSSRDTIPQSVRALVASRAEADKLKSRLLDSMSAHVSSTSPGCIGKNLQFRFDAEACFERRHQLVQLRPGDCFRCCTAD